MLRNAGKWEKFLVRFRRCGALSPKCLSGLGSPGKLTTSNSELFEKLLDLFEFVIRGAPGQQPATFIFAHPNLSGIGGKIGPGNCSRAGMIRNSRGTRVQRPETIEQLFLEAVECGGSKRGGGRGSGRLRRSESCKRARSCDRHPTLLSPSSEDGYGPNFKRPRKNEQQFRAIDHAGPRAWQRKIAALAATVGNEAPSAD